MLRLGASSVVLAGWLAAVPVAGLAVNGQSPKVTIKGSITYEAGGRYRLVGGVTYIVRATILSGTRAIWISDDVKIDVTASDVEAGTITLKPVKAGPDTGR